MMHKIAMTGIGTSIVKLARICFLPHPPTYAAWAFLGGVILQAVPAGSQAITSSSDLAKAIVERAQSSETVDLGWLGSKTCFVAESLYAPFYAKEWFPEYAMRDDQYRDKSEGVWNIIVSNDKERIVRIYSIDQGMLRWRVPEETKGADAVGCKSTVRVIVSGSSAEIFVF